MNQKKNISKETRALFDAATKGLELARLEARKIAIQTNTNLIVYDREKGIQKIPASELAKG